MKLIFLSSTYDHNVDIYTDEIEKIKEYCKKCSAFNACEFEIEDCSEKFLYACFNDLNLIYLEKKRGLK